MNLSPVLLESDQIRADQHTQIQSILTPDHQIDLHDQWIALQ